MHLKTDSVSVHHWLLDTLTRKAQLCTKAASKILHQRRLEIIKLLVKEYGLSIDITLVLLSQNLADPITRVPQRWLEMMKSATETAPLTCATMVDGMTSSQILKLHNSSGHPGIRCTTYFAQQVCPLITKVVVRLAIQTCEEYQTVDLALVHWTKRELAVKDICWRLGMDITHYNNNHFLIVRNCGATCFSIWRPLSWQDYGNVVRQLESIFFECGPPQELLMDNDTVFFSSKFKEFVASWRVHLRFRYVYMPTDNGIAINAIAVFNGLQSGWGVLFRKPCTGIT